MASCFHETWRISREKNEIVNQFNELIGFLPDHSRWGFFLSDVFDGNESLILHVLELIRERVPRLEHIVELLLLFELQKRSLYCSSK